MRFPRFLAGVLRALFFVAFLLRRGKNIDLHPQTTPMGGILDFFRGVVEWFIAPVLKTGDPLRGPGVRIPPPLPGPDVASAKSG